MMSYKAINCILALTTFLTSISAASQEIVPNIDRITEVVERNMHVDSPNTVYFIPYIHSSTLDFSPLGDVGEDLNVSQLASDMNQMETFQLLRFLSQSMGVNHFSMESIVAGQDGNCPNNELDPRTLTPVQVANNYRRIVDHASSSNEGMRSFINTVYEASPVTLYSCFDRITVFGLEHPENYGELRSRFRTLEAQINEPSVRTNPQRQSELYQETLELLNSPESREEREIDWAGNIARHMQDNDVTRVAVVAGAYHGEGLCEALQRERVNDRPINCVILAPPSIQTEFPELL
jgi:hypothetical protein